MMPVATSFLRPVATARLVWLAMLLVIFSHALLPTIFRPVLVSGSAFSAATADNGILPQARGKAGKPVSTADGNAGPAPVLLLPLLVLGLLCLAPVAVPLPPLPAAGWLPPLLLCPTHGPRAPPHA